MLRDCMNTAKGHWRHWLAVASSRRSVEARIDAEQVARAWKRVYLAACMLNAGEGMAFTRSFLKLTRKEVEWVKPYVRSTVKDTEPNGTGGK